MHTGVILLMEAESKDEALNKANDFLKQYQDEVWDWYQIGGRWNNFLCPFSERFYEESQKILMEHPSNKNVTMKGFVSHKSVKDNQDRLQELWVELGAKGLNPYCDHYNLPECGNEYDVMELKDCLDVVKKWRGDESPAEMGRTKEEEAKRYRDSGEKLSEYAYGHLLKVAGSIYLQNFTFDTSVYNIEEYSFSIPEDTIGWYAVMVDMHN